LISNTANLLRVLRKRPAVRRGAVGIFPVAAGRDIGLGRAAAGAVIRRMRSEGGMIADAP